jgi:hypothetical protein
MRFRTAALALLALAMAAPALGATVRFHHVVRKNGATRADVVYAEGGIGHARQPHVRISRRGRLLLTERVPVPGRHGTAFRVVPTFGDWFVVRDLDGDDEPEVSVEVWWYGAYCCAWSRVYRFDGRAYAGTTHWWGDLSAKPHIRDLDRDGRAEFLSVDDRFVALGPHVLVFYPVQIWAYDRGTFRDVTRRFPDVIARHATRLWRDHLKYREGRIDPYVLVAWAADEAMLGRGPAADRVLARAVRSPAYLAHLRAFLGRNGYG